MSHLTIVSGDEHAGAEPEVYRTYIEPAYRERIDDLVAENAQFLAMSTTSKDLPSEVLDLTDDQDTIRTGGESGARDVHRRLKEMDREGVAAEITFAGVQVAIQPFF